MEKGSSVVRRGWPAEVCPGSVWSSACHPGATAELAGAEHDLFLHWKAWRILEDDFQNWERGSSPLYLERNRA